jgi:Tfp pilus assembly protein PilN
MRPINLIPLEERRGQRAPLRAGPVAYVLVGGLVLAFAGVYLLVSAGNSISDHEAERATLQQQLDVSRERAEALQSFTEFASLEETRTQTVSDLARSRFDWERVMRELALVVPADVSLTNLTAAVSPEVAASSGSGSSGGSAAASTEEIEAPTLTMTGCGSSHDAVARLVAALRDIDGVTRVGLKSSVKSASGGGSAAASAAATAAAESGGACVDAASFEITVAFDGVELDSATGGIVPTLPPPEPSDGSGIAEAEADQAAARESAGSAVDESNEAVDTFVPGA